MVDDEKNNRVEKEFSVSNDNNSITQNKDGNIEFYGALFDDLTKLKSIVFSKALFYSSITSDLREIGNVIEGLAAALKKRQPGA